MMKREMTMMEQTTSILPTQSKEQQDKALYERIVALEMQMTKLLDMFTKSSQTPSPPATTPDFMTLLAGLQGMQQQTNPTDDFYRAIGERTVQLLIPRLLPGRKELTKEIGDVHAH